MTEDLVKTLSGKENLVKAQAWVGELGALLRPVLAHKNARGWAIESYFKNWPRVNTDGDSSLSLMMRDAGLSARDGKIHLLKRDLTASRNFITPSRALVGASTPSTRRVSVPADDLSEEPYNVRLLGMLVAEGIYVQDLATFQVAPGPWYEQYVALGPTGDNARKPTAADVITCCLDSAFLTGEVSEQDHVVACCWQGVWRYQELAHFLRNKLIREKYGLVTADVAFAAAHVPPPYSSPFHIHLTNLAFTHLKIQLFLDVVSNPLHPGIGIRLYDLTTGKPSTYLHQFTRAEVLLVRDLYSRGAWTALRALSATGPFQIFVAEAGCISGVELLDGLRYENSHEPWVPSCGCLRDVFSGFWHDVGRYNSTLMIGTQLQYCSFDGAKVLLDKSEDFCDCLLYTSPSPRD